MNWDAIRIEYEETDITMKDLAEKHDVKPATLRSRKNREKWQRNATNKVATKRATQRKNVATQKAEKIAESNSELKGWEIEFCYEYLKEFNATKAYRAVRDVTYNTAATEGMRTLRKPYIQKAIKDIKKETDAELFLSIEDIKREWVKQSFANISDYVDYGTKEVEAVDEDGDPIYNEDGSRQMRERSYVYFKDMSEIDGTLIKEVRMGKDGPVIQLYDKQRALIELQKRMYGTEELNNEFTKKRIEKLEEEIKLIKGKEPDTSLMKLLLNTVGEEDDD